MSGGHKAAIFLAVAGAVLLIVGMLFGGGTDLNSYIGVSKTLRDISVALWVFLTPSWFVLEDVWFAPGADDAEGLKRFRAGQNAARQTWVIVGGAVGIIIGVTGLAPTR